MLASDPGQLAVCIGVALLAGTLWYVLQSIQLWYRRHQHAAGNGCQPITLAYNKLPFALDRKWKIATCKGNVVEDVMMPRFVELGAWMYKDAWDNGPIVCAEPEAIKAILATKFADWGVGRHRQKALGRMFSYPPKCVVFDVMLMADSLARRWYFRQ